MDYNIHMLFLITVLPSPPPSTLEDQFSNIEISTDGSQVIVEGTSSHIICLHYASSNSDSDVILAATIPSLLILALILSLIILSSTSVAYHFYKAHKKHVSLNDNPQGMYEEASYSTVNSAVNVDLKTLQMEENSAYGVRNMDVMLKENPKPGTQ